MLTLIASMFDGHTPAESRAQSNGTQQARQAIQQTPQRAKSFLERQGQPLVGYAVNLHYNDDQQRYLDAIDDVAELGCNAVIITTPAFQTNGASTEIRLEVGPGRGPYRARLLELIQKVKQRGMTTVLMPMVLFTHPRGSEWRGKLVPDNWDRWWKSYERMTDYFVDIATEAKVDIFVVGSELLTTESQRHRWLRVITRVRDKFDGAITYSSNFDAFSDPTFWDAVDFIGMNAYFDLVGNHEDEHPPMEHLVERWKNHRENALAFSRSQGKPLLFTEMGYPSAPWGLKRPWEYIPYEDSVADHSVQRDGYDAFFQTWSDDLKKTQTGSDSPFAGVFFYEWDPYREGEIKDTFYGIRGKPTFQLVKDRLRDITNQR